MVAPAASVARDAKLAGIRNETTFDAVARSRSHLFFVMVAVTVGLSLATILSAIEVDGQAVIDPGTLRIGLVGLSVTFLAYAIEKERALRRLEHVLKDEHARHEALTLETERLHMVVDAGQALTASLELERVVELALDGSLKIFEAPAGAVFLDRGDLVLQAASSAVRRLDVAECRARVVAHAREPKLFFAGDRRHHAEGGDADESDTSTPAGMAAPLLHDGQLVGVLVLESVEDEGYGDADLEILASFAASAAAVMRHARAFQAERTTNERFAELDNVKAEFSWLNARA